MAADPKLTIPPHYDSLEEQTAWAAYKARTAGPTELDTPAKKPRHTWLSMQQPITSRSAPSYIKETLLDWYCLIRGAWKYFSGR